MVRPNQIIASDTDEGTLTFIFFARSEDAVKRRVLLLNFPGLGLDAVRDPDQFVTDVQPVTRGMVNRWAVTVDTDAVSGGGD